MRVVLVETDAAGRSGVAEVIERNGVVTDEALYEIFSGPLTRGARPPQEVEFLDMSPGSGAARWRIFEFRPDVLHDMHHTDTVDFDVVVDGSITLGLDRGEVELSAGDAVLLRGNRHSWRAGTKGCRMLIALLGAGE
jgi:quercetin dioxygenase-like cupin family protein